MWYKSYLCGMKPYRYIKCSESEQLSLESGYELGAKHHYRERCQAILFSVKGHTIPHIAELLGKRRETIHKWYDRWESDGLSGLGIKAGRGLKASLDTANVEIVAAVKKK